MAEEKYDRKWHEGYDPKADKKKYFLTDVIDYIDDTGGTALKNWWEDERKLEGWEHLNPISIGTFGATRAVEGVGWVLTNTPGVKQAVGGLARAEDIAAGTAGDLVGLVNIDPRVGGWGVRAATAWYGGPVAAKGVAKVAKATGVTAKVSKGVSRVAGALDDTAGEIAQRTRARRGHKWTRPGDKGTPIDRSDAFGPDDLTGPQKTYTRITDPKKPGVIPDDPWGPPMDVKDIARRHDMKMSLFRSIGVDDFEPFVPDFDEFLAIKKELPIIADANVTASHAKKLKKLKLGNLGSVFHREELTRVSKRTGLGQLTRRESQTISNESVKNFTKSAPERVGMVDELRSFYSNLSEKQIIPELDHKNPLKLSAYLMDGQDLAGRRNIRKIIFEESGLYTGDDARNFQALPREVHKIWTDNMNRVMGVELEKFIAEMVEQGITDRTKIAKIYARRVREQRNKFDKAYEAHQITHGVRRNPITGQDIIKQPEDIEKVLSALADIDIENWAPVRIRDLARHVLGDYNRRDPYRTKDVASEVIRTKMQSTYERIFELNQQLDAVDLSDDVIKDTLKKLDKLNKKFKALEDKLY